MLLGDQIASSVWIDIVVQNLLAESAPTDTTDFVYSLTCLRFLGQVLSCRCHHR